MIVVFTENGEVPTSIRNGGGIGTNEGADGEIIVTIPANEDLETSYEIHCMVEQPFTVVFPSGEGFARGGASHQEALLGAIGDVLIAKKTSESLWTGVLQVQ